MMTKETTTNLEKQLKGIQLTVDDTVYTDFAGDLSVCYECTLKDPKTLLALLKSNELKDLQAASDKRDWVEDWVSGNIFDPTFTDNYTYPSSEVFGMVVDDWDKD